jgi:DNA-binding HxlR family transcriptional regulator
VLRKAHPFSLSGLVQLCHHRWTVPLVAALGTDGGARFVVLRRELSVAPQTLRRALDGAIALGLVLPNPGYGHPLRPEYLLTERGRRLAPLCRVVSTVAGGLGETIARKWTLPVLAAVAAGAERFSEVEVAIVTASPRAASQALHALTDCGALERTIEEGRPPRPRYRIAPPARGLARASLELAAIASGPA